MSGGTFDYEDYRLTDIADKIETIIDDNDLGWRQYSTDTLSEFRTAIRYLRLAAIYAHRVDWLVAGDDLEENFHERLKNDLNEYETKRN